MFNEQKEEYSSKRGEKIPVWQSPKYIESRTKALEMIDSKKYSLDEGDFWILMNETKSGKMAYTGLIISHNGCLKINDALPADQKFKPECVTMDKEGYNGTLVYTYCCPEQGLFEVGEVNPKNCKIDYPYAMAFKRMMDRVVLKSSKLAFAGIYSEVEADEFKQEIDAPDEPKKTSKKIEKPKAETPETPKEEPNEQPKEEPVYKCRDCGDALVFMTDKNGKTWTPVETRDYSYKRYGRILCATCMKKAELQKKLDEIGESA